MGLFGFFYDDNTNAPFIFPISESLNPNGLPNGGYPGTSVL